METTFLQVKGAKGFAIIDAEDYEKVSPYEWQVETSGRAGWYHIGCRIGDKRTGQKCIRLSHMILRVGNSGDGRAYVTYLNGNRFDLRKANLHLSGGNITPTINETKFYFHRDKKRKLCSWVLSAYLAGERKQIRIGYYKTEEALKDVIQFIKDGDFSLSTKEGIEAAKPLIRTWALEKDYTNPPTYGTFRPAYEIGGERTNHSEHIEIKTEEGWQLKHHFVWKQYARKIPKRHKLLFKDGDKRNFDIDNLELVSNAENAHRLALRRKPEELRPLADATWQLQREIEKQSKKKTCLLKVIGTEKFAVVNTEDFEKVKDFNWKHLNSQGKKVVGYRAKIGRRQYKIVTLAHKIFDIDPKEKVRITQLNKRVLDYRRKNLSVHYFDRPEITNKPSFSVSTVKNRIGAKSNHRVNVGF